MPGATDVAPNAPLTWSATGATSYDVAIGTTNPPTVVAAGLTSATYAPALIAGTTYYWQVVARGKGGITTGPVWSFRTAPAPGVPATPSPAAGATSVSPTAMLTWSATGATSYDIAFGTTNPPVGAGAAGFGSTSYAPTPALAAGTTYFWQVVARNAGGSTTGPVWSFTTAAVPGVPTTPSPGAGATNVAPSAPLTWSASGATSYDVTIGTTNPPTTGVSGLTSGSYMPALAAGTTYFWQVVARNAGGQHDGAGVVVYDSSSAGRADHTLAKRWSDERGAECAADVERHGCDHLRRDHRHDESADDGGVGADERELHARAGGGDDVFLAGGRAECGREHDGAGVVVYDGRGAGRADHTLARRWCDERGAECVADVERVRGNQL